MLIMPLTGLACMPSILPRTLSLCRVILDLVRMISMHWKIPASGCSSSPLSLSLSLSALSSSSEEGVIGMDARVTSSPR